MKNVISVDTILQDFLAKVATSTETNPLKQVELVDGWMGEVAVKLHSLLISKLPEKKLTNSAFEERRLSTPESVQNAAYNSAIDNMRKSIDELFGVDNG